MSAVKLTINDSSLLFVASAISSWSSLVSSENSSANWTVVSPDAAS